MSVWRVIARRVAFDEPSQRRIGKLRIARRATVDVAFEHFLEQAGVRFEVGEALDVQRVVDTLVDRVLTHERVGSFYSEFALATLEVGVHELELYLLGELAERITCLDQLINLDGTTVIAAKGGFLGHFITVLQILDRRTGSFVGGTGDKKQGGDQGRGAAGAANYFIHYTICHAFFHD